MVKLLMVEKRMVLKESIYCQLLENLKLTEISGFEPEKEAERLTIEAMEKGMNRPVISIVKRKNAEGKLVENLELRELPSASSDQTDQIVQQELQKTESDCNEVLDK